MRIIRYILSIKPILLPVSIIVTIMTSLGIGITAVAMIITMGKYSDYIISSKWFVTGCVMWLISFIICCIYLNLKDIEKIDE